MIINSDLGRQQKEIMTYFKAPFQHLPVETARNHEKYQFIQQVFPEYEGLELLYHNI